MGNIIIQESWWTDPRRNRLVKSMGGDTHRADGLMLELWKLGRGGVRIKESLLDTDHIEMLLKAGLVEKTAKGLYVKGSRTYKNQKADSAVPKPVKPNRHRPAGVPSTSSKVWDAYRDAYLRRHKTEPVRNMKVNGQIGHLVARLGEEAVEVVKFYVEHPSSFYLSKLHDIGMCLKDAESLRTQWKKNSPITANDIKQHEKQDHFKRQMDLVNKGEL